MRRTLISNESPSGPRARTVRLAYFVSHPIQYQGPLLRRIAEEPDIDLHVFFSSEHSTRGFLDEGFGVTVRWDVPLLDGYSYEFLPGRPASDFSGCAWSFHRGIFERLEQGAFDAVWVHGYSSFDALQAIFSASTLDVPVLLRAESTLHDRRRSWLKLMAKKYFFSVLRKQIRGVLAIGTENECYWRTYFGQDVPIFSMPYAVDNAFFAGRAAAAASQIEQLRSHHRLESGRPVVMFASKLQERKRCIDLIEAWRRLEAPRPYLIIIGDGDQRKQLEESARGEDCIRFLGFKNQTELPAYLALCDVFVLPSVFEPWGLVVNEAMVAGCAVIVSDEVGCYPDLVEDGVQGRVFRARDVDGLARALEQVLGTPGLAAAMGAAARERMCKHSFEEDVAGLRQALAHLIQGFAAKDGGEASATA